MTKSKTTHFRGNNGKSYKTVSTDYGKGSGRSTTYEKSSTVFGWDKPVKTEKWKR